MLFYVEADDHHSTQSRTKMSGGLALTDDDRWPWLDTLCEVVNRRGDQLAGQFASCDTSLHIYLACSCLKRTYRDVFRQRLRYPVRFIYLNISEHRAQQRAAARVAHFMPASLVASQFAALEAPTHHERADAPSDVLVLDGDMDRSALLAMAIEALAHEARHETGHDI
ncbi:hypothetical protein SYNPS1DRAFT_11940 [Syncephalis pseudoplumigaleata]|uniref:gluconokinase n=1 Tax=Syncephalis pseudoplumigaleata TaxID=1712513 RepID=A0A4P9Z7P2_9FUNG|nr:hypothetical protein SYNPS1DRAFT_11940 [Syncephalis pseudoplumigaleata]|eukprot:RKP27931.1 hypothetical protein SYNPS1DRAFT_11940 [Syncephalis pseudoplumigaleata]